ncbi:MAG TPA: DegT/DnrJ/EryC1/StrS family aminotransferase [Micromonosporaceae bacterium]|nr:DegT/DnrJ/EryC1/StrS family aminotransferase [Micromonosporaceae bacterium]
MSTPPSSPSAARLEADAAEAFGTESAVSTVSGSAAVMAAASCLATPGQAALLPGWVCSGVVYALIHAGLRPVPVDVGPDLSASVTHARTLLTRYDVGLAVYAPYGGSPRDLPAWAEWAHRNGVPLLVDLAQAPDPAVWRVASRAGAVAVTSFRGGKPLGADGGGVAAGSPELLGRIRLFLAGGRDGAGRKVALGLELPLHPAAADAARAVLAAHPAAVPAWRESTRQALEQLRDVLLPGWGDALPGWGGLQPAVSRVPCLGGPGTPLHPDRTYQLPAVREAVAARLGAGAAAAGRNPAEELPVPGLGALYDRLRVVKVRPGAQYAGARYAGTRTVAGDVT